MRPGVVGLVPAAGTASRLPGVTGSKELLPVWRPELRPDTDPQPAIRCLLSALETAQVGRSVIVIRTGKEDIPSALGTATGGGMRLEYVHTEGTPSPPFTLDAAVPKLADSTVVLGFPDILFEPTDAVARLLDRLGGEETDILLGLFPHPETRRADVVSLGLDDRVVAVDPRSPPGSGRLTWGLAAWRSGFSHFLHDWVGELDPASSDARRLGVGHAINAAIERGLSVRGERISDAPFLDVGTPEALAEAYRRLA
ncbi:MAG: hypothetical protein KJO06_10705 [Gemmatimonadetes bacterium]|nr:hypothetical protein [Gemmatimonadota bacterium]